MGNFILPQLFTSANPLPKVVTQACQNHINKITFCFLPSFLIKMWNAMNKGGKNQPWPIIDIVITIAFLAIAVKSIYPPAKKSRLATATAQ